MDRGAKIKAKKGSVIEIELPGRISLLIEPMKEGCDIWALQDWATKPVRLEAKEIGKVDCPVYGFRRRRKEKK